MNHTFSIGSRRGVSIGTFLLMLVVMAGMVAISVPGIARMHRENIAEMCTENLVRIENAKIQYALDHKLSEGAPVDLETLVKAYPERFKNIPRCLADGTYAVGTIGTTPTCSLAAQGHVIRRIVSRDRAMADYGR